MLLPHIFYYRTQFLWESNRRSNILPATKSLLVGSVHMQGRQTKSTSLLHLRVSRKWLYSIPDWYKLILARVNNNLLGAAEIQSPEVDWHQWFADDFGFFSHYVCYGDIICGKLRREGCKEVLETCFQSIITPCAVKLMQKVIWLLQHYERSGRLSGAWRCHAWRNCSGPQEKSTYRASIVASSQVTSDWEQQNLTPIEFVEMQKWMHPVFSLLGANPAESTCIK